MKVVKKRTPEAAEIAIDAMPEHQTDAMARTLISCVSRLFEDPRIAKDFQNWKKKREHIQREAKA